MNATASARSQDAAPGQVLNRQVIDQFDDKAFRNRHPFPWQMIDGLISDETHQQLCDELPGLDMFSASFGKRRRHGQESHNRYVLNESRKLALSPLWRAFVEELKGPLYKDFVSRMMGRKDFTVNLHWHYTPAGCSVSPHCDAEWKLGSHIFYFNDPAKWDEAWGGQTLVLDDGHKISWRSAPAFEDFDEIIDTPCSGNRNLVFLREDHSWHGVKAHTAPEGVLRKVLIAEYRKDDLANRVRKLFV